MDDFPDLVRRLTPNPDKVDPDARARLRDAFAHERRRSRRDWFFVRALSVGVVLFVVWSIAPATPTDEELPLIGLAQATAQLAAPEPSPGEQWYVREERADRMSIVDNTGDTPGEIALMVHTVEETWVDLEDETVQRSSASDVEVVSSDDEETFARLKEGNPGVVPPQPPAEERTVDTGFSTTISVWSGGADAMYEAIHRAVGVREDIRMKRLAMLDVAAELMQRHGAYPSRRATLLLTIARIPGIEVEVAERQVRVRYQYVVGDVAREVRYDFDRATGALVGRAVATLATPTSPSLVASESRYESRLAVLDHEES